MAYQGIGILVSFTKVLLDQLSDDNYQIVQTFGHFQRSCQHLRF